MKNLSADLQSHLDTKSTTMVTCWKVVRKDGLVQGFTEHDEDVEFDGVVYLASAGFTASRYQQNLGMAASNLNANGALSSETINESDLAAGHYDNAAVTIYWVNWDDVSERVTLDAGNLGEVSREETTFSAEFRSLAHRLNQVSGRVYQRSCDAVLGDARCGINLASSSYKATGTVVSASGRDLVLTGLDSFASDFFLYGVLVFTSGANDDLIFEVKSHTSGNISLWELPPSTVEVGDSFSITAGCKKDAETCGSKFSNIANFRGFNLIPGNDVLQSYPSAGDENMDGSSFFR